MNEFFRFRRMLTPTIIEVVFIVGAALIVVGGLLTAIMSAVQAGGRGVIAGLLVAVFGPLILRIYCEVLIVIFKIHESLQELVERAPQRS